MLVINPKMTAFPSLRGGALSSSLVRTQIGSESLVSQGQMRTTSQSENDKAVVVIDQRSVVAQQAVNEPPMTEEQKKDAQKSALKVAGLILLLLHAAAYSLIGTQLGVHSMTDIAVAESMLVIGIGGFLYFANRILHPNESKDLKDRQWTILKDAAIILLALGAAFGGGYYFGGVDLVKYVGTSCALIGTIGTVFGGWSYLASLAEKRNQYQLSLESQDV